MKIHKIFFIASFTLLIMSGLFLSGCQRQTNTNSMNQNDSNENKRTGKRAENPNQIINNRHLLRHEDLAKEYSRALVKTNVGNFEFKFYTEETPITVNNFLNLAQNDFYDNIKFHRIIKNFIIQSGDPLTKQDEEQKYWGTGGPGYSIPNENVEELSNLKGTISMANSGPGTGGSQFFINLKDNTFLDYNKTPRTSQHTVFGEVVNGMDTIEKISKVETNKNDAPKTPIIIKEVTLKP